jgi:hypothetical protein
MSRTWKLVLALVLVAGGACKNDTATQADRAAHHLVTKTEGLREAQTKLDEGAAAERVKVADHEDEVSRAADEFAVRRQTRIDRLRGEHAVMATQAGVVRALAASFPLTDVGRSNVGEKLTVFEMRLDDAAHAISALQDVPASEFEDRDDSVTKAMTRLDDARKATWSALDNAPRLDRTSQR